MKKILSFPLMIVLLWASARGSVMAVNDSTDLIGTDEMIGVL
jgi:hypothetical protein